MEESLNKKDAFRLFKEHCKLIGIGKPPRILKGPTFDDAYSQSLKYIGYIEECWGHASELFLSKKYSFSIFFSILTLEETGKLCPLRFELISFSKGTPDDYCEVNRRDWFYKHRSKHLMAACQGALVNSRLDHILGVDRVAKFIKDAEHGKIEEIRQACLYLSCDRDETKIPSQLFLAEDAMFFAVLSGEVMAEVLGVDPNLWEKLLRKVSSFEKKLKISK